MDARASNRSRRPVRAAGMACAALLALSAPAVGQVEESALKAAFVYNIIAFASWDALPRSDLLVVCTAVEPGFGTALAALEGKQVDGRRIALRAASDEMVDCNVLVRAQVAPPASPMDGRLVVCDGCVLPDAVTAVSLVRDGTRVRFEVDVAAGSRAGITFSSRLLRLARRVL